MNQIPYKARSRFIYIISALVLVVTSVCLLAKPIMKIAYPLKFENIIYKYSNMYELDAFLVMALISAESRFDEKAVSHKNAKGLMQLRDETADWCIREFGIDESLDANSLNINIGCSYLKYLIDKYKGNTDTALAAYNAGEGNVSKWLTEQSGENSVVLCSIPFAETEKYVKKINQRVKIYRFLYS